MGWVTPAIIAGSGLVNWFANRNKEKNAIKQGQKDYDAYYHSPYMTAVNAYLRQYWGEHGLADKFGGNNALLDSLLTPRPFDPKNPKFKRPGAGAQLGGAFIDALAAHFAPKPEADEGKTTSVLPSGRNYGSALYGSGGAFGSSANPGPPRGPAALPTSLSDPTANDAQSILESILGPDAPTAVGGPAFAGPLRRYYRNPAVQGL